MDDQKISEDDLKDLVDRLVMAVIEQYGGPGQALSAFMEAIEPNKKRCQPILPSESIWRNPKPCNPINQPNRESDKR